DENGTVLMVNDAYCKMFSTDRENVINKPFSVVYKEETQEGILSRHIERFRNRNIQSHIQQQIILWNNRRLWVEVSNSFLELGGEKPLLVCIFHDITERKTAEERLTKLNECFLSFGPNARENISSLVSFTGKQLNANFAMYNVPDKDDLFTAAHWNLPEGFRIAGKAKGKICYDVINGKYHGTCVLRNLTDTGYAKTDPNVSAYNLRTYMGRAVLNENIPVGSLCVVYNDDYSPSEDDLNLLGIAASAIGVEEKRLKADAELRIAKESAERADKLKTDFLAQMSHEIRTPINTILSFTSLLREELEGKIQEDLSSSFKIIDNGGRRLTRTIDMILTMSQLQSGNYELNTKKLNIFEDLLEGLYKEFINVAQTKGLELTLNKNADHAFVDGDLYTLTQLFQNLIDNAIKYTKKGKVEIVVNQNNGSGLSVDVRDTGIGISKDYIPHIFSPFSQEETGYTRRFEGNGLGLALVKKYAELNNALIKVKSEKGKGSIFTVAFPTKSE
ncbi:MAG: ATP-binding protein, partial [Bacillota bacterium]